MEPSSGKNNQGSQQCAICLEKLFRSSCAMADAKVCAVVPCGHVFHSLCCRRLQAAHTRRLARESRNNVDGNLACKCPMCNAPAENFVTLYMGAGANAEEDDDNTAASNDEEGVDANDLSSNYLNALDATPEGVIANQERIKNKLKRYKKQNKSLKKELKAEREEMEEMLVGTIQNFYNFIEKHENERKTWGQGAVELRKELEWALKNQEKERRDWSIERKRMKQELQRVKMDCETAEYRVQRAAQGLDELKLYNKQRQSKLHALLNEKARLVHENRKLKNAVLSAHGPVRSENLHGV